MTSYNSSLFRVKTARLFRTQRERERERVIFVLRPVRIKRSIAGCPSSAASGPAATCRKAWEVASG